MAKVFGWLFLWNFKKKASAIFYGTAFPCMKPFSSAARIPVRLAPHISSGGPRDGSLRMKRRTPPISMSRYGSPPRPPGILFRPYPACKKGFFGGRNFAIPAGHGARPPGERWRPASMLRHHSGALRFFAFSGKAACRHLGAPHVLACLRPRETRLGAQGHNACHGRRTHCGSRPYDPENPNARCSAQSKKPEGIAAELADVIIRVLDYCAYAGIDIENVLEVKHEYNKSRPYRHGGKKC